MEIPGLRGLGPTKLVKQAIRQFDEHDMATYAAAVTYHVIFSLFPFIIFFIALLGYLELSDLFDWLRQRAETFFLQQTMTQINQIFDHLQQRRRGILSFGAIVALWAASSGMRAAMNALNVVYGVKEARPVWKRYPLSLLYTTVVGAMLVVATVLVLVAPQAMQSVAQQIGMGHFSAVLWAWWLRWPVVVLLLTLTVAIVYAVAPDVEQRFRFVSPGAFLAVVVWIVASLVFNFYVRNVANFDALYGSIGTIIVLLLFFFISLVVLLFGAEINVVIEHHAPTGKNAGEKRIK
ncbi:MAG: YihY/virulence factor BrkB family protein [Herminiimonas sp.]|jgi:membrane protein|nr:YihY/virulence factor BrkB family protein [Herminiimonas sp.]